MRSRRGAAALAIAALAVLAVTAAAAWILHVPPTGDVRFSADDCRRFALIDAGSGRPVTGAEDIALTSDSGHLIVSAYDRFADERRSGADGAAADGNLYAVPVAALAGESFAAVPLVDVRGFPGGFRPHGIAVAPGERGPAGDLLLAVRRSGTGRSAEARPAAPASGPDAAENAVTIEVFRLGPSAPAGPPTADGPTAQAGPTAHAGQTAHAGPTAQVGSRQVGASAGAAALVHLASFGDPRLCRANDLAVAGARVFVTLDRIDCAPGWRDLLVGNSGRVLRLALDPGTGALTGPEIAAGAIDFANGILHDPARERLAVAATRGGLIMLFAAPDAADADTEPDVADAGDADAEPDAGSGTDAEQEDSGATADAAFGGPLAMLEVAGGGPDNLSLAEGGRIVAAVHPNLIRLALYRHGWPGGAQAPSRIVAIDPATGTEEILFDDPEGRLFSAATSAVLIDANRLVAGSVGDAGLLVCEKNAGAPTEATTLRPATENRGQVRGAPATVRTASMTAPNLFAALSGPAAGAPASILGAPAQAFGAPARILVASTAASAARGNPDVRRA